MCAAASAGVCTDDDLVLADEIAAAVSQLKPDELTVGHLAYVLAVRDSSTQDLVEFVGSSTVLSLWLYNAWKGTPFRDVAAVLLGAGRAGLSLEATLGMLSALPATWSPLDLYDMPDLADPGNLLFSALAV